jgi:hypothetical protein
MMPLDRFSGHAGLYAQYRIDYPADLYDFLMTYVTNRAMARSQTYWPIYSNMLKQRTLVKHNYC